MRRRRKGKRKQAAKPTKMQLLAGVSREEEAGKPATHTRAQQAINSETKAAADKQIYRSKRGTGAF